MASYETFPGLPQEMVDKIVDQCPHDKGFLQACALVNTKLRPRAQSHLFKSVDLSSPERARVLSEIIQKNPRIASYISHIGVFTTLDQVIRDHGLDLSLPVLVAFIIAQSYQVDFRVFISGDAAVNYAYGTYDNISAEQERCLAAVTYLSLKDIFSFSIPLFRKFKAVTHLTLDNASLDSDIADNSELLAEDLHSFQHLTVSNVNTDEFPLSLISKCHDLNELTIENTTVDPADFDEDWTPDFHRPMIKHLWFAACDLGTIQALLNLVVNSSKLVFLSDLENSTFRGDELSVEDVLCTNHIIELCGRSLQHLRLYCALEYPMPRNAIYNLAYIPRLRSLELLCPCSTDDHQIHTPVYMRDVLQTIDVQRSEIREIVFSFEIRLGEYGDEVDPVGITVLPLAFEQAAWVDIKAVLTRLAAHSALSILLAVTILFVTTESDDVSPAVELTLFGVLDQWARQNLTDDTETSILVIAT